MLFAATWSTWRFPTKTGGPAFNLKFNFIFRSVNDRLRQFGTTDACGQWNSTLIEDFRSDSTFVRTADDLFCEVVAQHSNRECITSDGLSLETVTIDIGTSINLCFQLNFLDAPNGFGQAPAQFSVAPDPAHRDCKLATLCCGLREPDGDFWYPASRRLPNVVLPDDYEWAFRHTRIYGPPNISSWIERQAQKRGEQ